MSVYDDMTASGEMVPADAAGLRQGIADDVPFPQSYVAFIRRFGYGLTCGRFLIYPPLGDFPDSFHEQSPGIKIALLATLKPRDRAYDWQLEPDGNCELLEGLIGFGTGENGESLFWDVRGRTQDGEYPVYLTGSGMGIRHGGVSLEHFISRLADPAEFKKVLPLASSPRPLTFCAAPSTHLQAWRQKRSSA